MKAQSNMIPSKYDSRPSRARKMGRIVMAEPIIMSRRILSAFVEMPRERKAAMPMTRVALITFDPRVTAITRSPAPIMAEDMEMNSSGILVAIASSTKAVINSEMPKALAAAVIYLITNRPARTRIISAIRNVTGLGSM